MWLIILLTVGLATKEGKIVKARVLTISSALDVRAKFTGQELPIKQVRSQARKKTHNFNKARLWTDWV